MRNQINLINVFSVTKARERDELGQRVTAWIEANPQVEIFTYPAGHGFNCEARASYDAGAAAQAYDRTLAFFRKHIG